MADFWTSLNQAPEKHVEKRRRPDPDTLLGKRDFNGYVERDVGERFYETASRLTSAFLSSAESAMYDPADQEGTVADRIARNTEQFVTALIAAVEDLDGSSAGENSTGDMTKRAPVLKTRAAVMEEATALAKSSYPELAARNISAARARIWKERPDLAARHSELSVENATTAKHAKQTPVLKGQGALQKIDAEAANLRKADPRLSEREARTQAARQHPELRDEYHRAFAR